MSSRSDASGNSAKHQQSFTTKDGNDSLPSGMSVRAQPPPPAPVNLVARPKGSAAVDATIMSSDGCETPSCLRCWWLSRINSYESSII